MKRKKRFYLISYWWYQGERWTPRSAAVDEHPLTWAKAEREHAETCRALLELMGWQEITKSEYTRYRDVFP